jgi:hypothetical protein
MDFVLVFDQRCLKDKFLLPQEGVLPPPYESPSKDRVLYQHRKEGRHESRFLEYTDQLTHSHSAVSRPRLPSCFFAIFPLERWSLPGKTYDREIEDILILTCLRLFEDVPDEVSSATR